MGYDIDVCWLLLAVLLVDVRLSSPEVIIIIIIIIIVPTIVVVVVIMTIICSLFR